MLKIRLRKETSHTEHKKGRTQNTGNVAHRTQETSHTEHRKRIHWTVLLKWIFNNWVGGMEWLGLAGYRDRWLAWSGWVWLGIGTGGGYGVVGPG